MTIGIRGTASGTTGSTASATTVSVTVPAAAQAGDVAYLACHAERTTDPTGVPAGFTVMESGVINSNSDVWVGRKVLTSGDLGATWTFTQAAGRRMVAGLVVLSGAGTGAPDLAWNGAGAAGASDTALETPSVTPTTASPMLLSILLAISTVTPFVRTLTTPAGWTQDVNVGAPVSTSSDPYLVISHRQITGGSGVAQAGPTYTSDQPQTNYGALTLAVPVATGNALPTANAGPDQTVEPWSTVTLSGSGTDTDGTIAAYSWTQTSGTAVTLTGATTATPTFIPQGSLSTATYVFALTVTDNLGGTATDSVAITVPQATEAYLDSNGTWQPLRVIPVPTSQAGIFTANFGSTF